MATRQVVLRGAAAIVAMLPSACGGDGDDSADDDRPETTTSTTEEPTTTTTPEPDDACSAVDASEVEAVLGAGASSGDPVTVEADGDGCVWHSAEGADALGAVTLTTIPGDGEAEDLFPLFDLDPGDYSTTGVSTSQSGTGGPSVVVVYGLSMPGGDVREAVAAVAAALAG